MRMLLLTTLVSLLSGSGVSPCDAAKSQRAVSTPLLTPKEICRVEQRLNLLTRDMSEPEVFKTLKLSGKKVPSYFAWQGTSQEGVYNATYYFGYGYNLHLIFRYSEDKTLKLISGVMDGQGWQMQVLQ